jgi:hypothetical protein
VTDKVRKRTWAEPLTRSWLLATAALLLASVFMAVRAAREWTEESHVVRNGVVVQALAWHAGSNRVPQQTLTSTSRVDMEYQYQGKTYRPTNQLLYKTAVEYVSMKPFDIRIDPENPGIWTNRTDAPPLIEKMMGVVIVLAVVVTCAVVALILRQRSMSLWVNGDQVSARIIRQGQSALAPQSVVLRCAMRDGKIERLVNVYVPQKSAPSEATQTIQLVVSLDRSRALALTNYHP